MSIFGFGKGDAKSVMSETERSDRKRSSRFSNVNIQILNTLTSDGKGKKDEEDKTF